MKTVKTGAIAAILLAALFFSACKKTGTSPSGTPQLSFELQADNSTAATASTNPGVTTNAVAGLNWTAGVANVSKFKLEAKKDGVETELTSKNLTNIDLFALAPLLTNITIAPGTYTEIEVKVYLQKSAGDAIPLKLTGTFTNSGGTVIPIEFDLNDDVIVKAEAENITVDATTDYISLIHMHLGRLAAGITAATIEAATQTDGKIIISNSSNTAIYNKVLANLAISGESEMRGHHHGDDDNGGHDDNSGHN
ncbi:MAG TPA: hypothetical protein VK668_07870 [Mucilaginibacter sp.]|nr:hypothetical protein [Mucilaginibacter sp.]